MVCSRAEFLRPAQVKPYARWALTSLGVGMGAGWWWWGLEAE